MINGTVFWITGLAGAGKSSIGRRFFEHLHARHPNSVFLDGDQLREVFGNDLGHTREQRLESATRNARLCKLLSDQGIHVVCATISMMHEVRNWNRAHIPSYREIYVRAPLAILQQRDPKGLYSGAQRGQIRNVVGVDIAAEEPASPDLVLDNDNSQGVGELADFAWSRLGPGLQHP